MNDQIDSPLTHSKLQNTQAYANQNNMVSANKIFAVAIWIFAASGGFVSFEPSLFELLGAIIIPIAYMCGYTPHPKHALLTLSSFMLIGAGIITFVVSPELGTDWIRYHFITIFILMTMMFFASVAHEKPHWVEKYIIPAMIIAAAMTSILGILGYMGIGYNQFTLYGRAKGAFKDPNVFATFLILPIIYCVAAWIRYGIFKFAYRYFLFLIIFAGIFLSFSRAAWGISFLSLIMISCLAPFTNKDNPHSKTRLVIIIGIASILLIVGFIVIMSIESTREMVLLRLQPQDYDTAEGGRFDRYSDMFPMIAADPWGKGHIYFGTIYGEDPHNTWLKMFISFGWLGGLSHLLLTVSTLFVGIYGMIRNTPWQIASISLVIAYLGLTLEALIIDVDHWRVYYVIIGLIWGLAFTSTTKYKSA